MGMFEDLQSAGTAIFNDGIKCVHCIINPTSLLEFNLADKKLGAKLPVSVVALADSFVPLGKNENISAATAVAGMPLASNVTQSTKADKILGA